jgi:hypothetical protein
MAAAIRQHWRDRAAFLLGEAAGMAEPDTYNCCSPGGLCPRHEQDMDASRLVAAIRGAVAGAAGQDDAGRRIAAVLAAHCGAAPAMAGGA